MSGHHCNKHITGCVIAVFSYHMQISFQLIFNRFADFVIFCEIKEIFARTRMSLRDFAFLY